MGPRTPVSGRVLIADADAPFAALLAELIRTHCPGARVDICAPEERSLLEDNCGGADLAIISCLDSRAATFDTLRELLTLRPCLSVLVLIPADRPELADAAIAAGAADVLLRAPGYLDQLAVCVRKNVRLAKARTSDQVRTTDLTRRLHERTQQVAALHKELAEQRSPAPDDAATPVIRIRSVNPARAA